MTLEEAKKIIFEKKPEFAKLWQTYGDKAWIEYAKDNYSNIPNLPTTKRSEEFLDTFLDVLTPLIGIEKAQKAVETFKTNSLVSSADHHGILCHPFFSNSALVRSHPSLINKDSSLITFSCGCISLTNSSYPRGIFFHDSGLEEVRMPFASLKGRRRSLYGLPAITKQNIQKEIDGTPLLNINDEAKKRLRDFLSKIINSPSVWKQKYFSEQITAINDIIWDEMFNDNRGNLVYLEIETLVRNLILRFHLETDSTVSKIIFNKEYRDRYIKNFEKVTGAHDTESRKGSHLFWYIDSNENTRKQLFIEQNNLVSLDKTISIPIIKESIESHLKDYSLMPSMALCYSIISFYYGVILGGGFSQIQYLEDMKKAFAKAINEPIIDTKTNIFTGEEVLLTLGKDTAVIPASLIDTLIYSNDKINEVVDSEIENKKISDTLSYMMDEFVEIVTSKKEEIEDLPKIHSTFNV